MGHPSVLLTIVGVLAVLGLLIGVTAAGAEDSESVRQQFAQPARGYSSGPLWVWNDLLSEEQIVHTLSELAAQDVRQPFVHPRPGLMTPYLSADWFRLWKVALREAERLDMNVWIYDENSYPSGFAGGLVPEAMPESRGRGLHINQKKTIGELDDSVLAVFRVADGEYEDITDEARAGKEFPEGTYLIATVHRAGSSPWFGGKSYVDLTYPGVTEKFIEITMDAYRREIGDQFGKRVPGWFTDEPHLAPAGGLHWTDDLPEAFEERWGYSLLDNLPSLIRDVGDWQRVRHNYFRLILELFIDRWAKPCYEYCEKHNLEFTGHYWEHGWPGAGTAPDNMAMYAWHQRPAIDTLFNRYSEDVHAQFGNVRAVLELESVANQLGRRRTLCEAYGGSGWDARFEDFKRIGDWLYVLGVNTLNEHLSFITIRGARKRDYPPSFSYHEPWWDSYHVMAQYFTRLSLALSSGEQVNRILVLEPTTTAWMYQSTHGDRREALGRTFQKLVTDLAKAQVEFDIGCEDIMARHGSADGKRLVVGRRAYDVVVVPASMENLNEPTVGLLETYLKSGGTVLSCGDGPTRVDGQASERVKGLAQNAGWEQVEAAALAKTLLERGEDGFAVRIAEGSGGILYHHRRQLDDGDLVFLANTSIEQGVSGWIESTASTVEQWRLESGAVVAYRTDLSDPTDRSDDTNRPASLTAKFDLPPCGSLLLFLSDKSGSAEAPVFLRAAAVASSGDAKIDRRSPNVLTIDYVDVTAGGETKERIHFHRANTFVFQKHGLNNNPWDHAVQFRDELIAKTFPVDSGFEATYRFTVEDAVPDPLHIVIERPDLYTITCNGQPVTAEPDAWWLDKAFGKIDLAAVAKVGENTVTIKASPFTVFHELESAYVLGDFALRPSGSGFVIAPEVGLQLGPWDEQGHALYSHDVVYTQQFEIAALSGRYAVTLPSWYGSVAKVVVNGTPAGHIFHAPWECDATDFLKVGENTIDIVVIGTLKNTMGPHHGNPGLGFAGPGSFHSAPETGPPPGKQYDTIGYGLFEQFELRRLLPPDEWRPWAQAEVAALQEQLDQIPWEDITAAQHEWEETAGWTLLEPAKFRAVGATLKRLDDGSLLAEGDAPETDAYTVVATAGVPGITGFRIEVLPHESLPENGPGRAFNGNFVLNDLRVTDPDGNPVTLRNASADYEQDGFPVANAIDRDASNRSGWGVNGATGQRHTAVFEAAKPINTDRPLTFKLTQSFGSQHTVGRFRILATTQRPPVRMTPPDIERILALEPGERSDDDQAALASYYRSVNVPETAALDKRLNELLRHLQRFERDG